MRINRAVADPEALNQENTSAFNRLGYDPAMEQRRPSREELDHAAREIFSRVKIRQPKS